MNTWYQYEYTFKIQGALRTRARNGLNDVISKPEGSKWDTAVGVAWYDENRLAMPPIDVRCCWALLVPSFTGGANIQVHLDDTDTRTVLEHTQTSTQGISHATPGECLCVEDYRRENPQPAGERAFCADREGRATERQQSSACPVPIRSYSSPYR